MRERERSDALYRKPSLAARVRARLRGGNAAEETPEARAELEQEMRDTQTGVRSRFETSGDLASGGVHRYDFGYGLPSRAGVDLDSVARHAATIRAIVRMGGGGTTDAVEERDEGPRGVDEFDFASYPRAHGRRRH